MVATVTKGEGLLVDKLLPHPHSPGQQPSLWPPALTSVFLGFPELQAAVLQLGEDLGNAENVPLSPGTGHHHPHTPPSALRPAPQATPRRPAAPSAASCKRSEPPRPGSGAGRWPAARPSCPGRLAGVELKETEPPGTPTPLPLTQFQGDDPQPGPGGQAEGGGRLSLLFPGLGNCSRTPLGAPGLRSGGGNV